MRIKSARTGRGANLHHRGAVAVMMDGFSFLAWAAISRFTLGSSVFAGAKILFAASSRRCAGVAACIKKPPAPHLSLRAAASAARSLPPGPKTHDLGLSANIDGRPRRHEFSRLGLN